MTLTVSTAGGRGATATDTLYVAVGPSDGDRGGDGERDPSAASGASVRIEGPRVIAAGATATFRATGSFDAAAWSTNRSDVRIAPTADGGDANATATVDAPPGATVAVRVRGVADGDAAVAVRRVRVVAGPDAPRPDPDRDHRIELDRFEATHLASDRNAFTTPVAVRNGTATVRFRVAARHDRWPTYAFRFADETVNRSVHQWRDATLDRTFRFAPDAFAGGPVERAVTVVVRDGRSSGPEETDEATRTVTFRGVDRDWGDDGTRNGTETPTRSDGAGEGHRADDATTGGDGDATGESDADGPPRGGPIVGLRR